MGDLVAPNRYFWSKATDLFCCSDCPNNNRGGQDTRSCEVQWLAQWRLSTVASVAVVLDELVNLEDVLSQPGVRDAYEGQLRAYTVPVLAYFELRFTHELRVIIDLSYSCLSLA